MDINGDNKLYPRTASTDPINSSSEHPDIELLSNNGKLRKSILLWFLFIFAMCINIGISILPAIFFFNPSRTPDTPAVTNTTSNHSVMPPPFLPCNLPLKQNPVTGLCDLPCAWTYFTPDQDVAQRIIDNISLAINLLGFVFVLLTWISLKQLRVFPNVIPLYIQGTASAISLVILIGNGMKTEKAFCSHEFLSESRAHPTPFCVAQGILIQYFSNVTAMWFVVYSFCLVQMIFSQNTLVSNQSTKLKHAISAACCYLLPVISVCIVLTDKGYGTVAWGRLCLPLNYDLTFYTNTLITEIALGVGCSGLLVVVFKLFRLRDLDAVEGEQSKRRKRRLDTVATRLVCLMFAFAICTSLVYIPMCVAAKDKNLLEYYLRNYVGCLMFAPASACKNNQVEFENHTNAKAFIVSYLSSALFTASTVCFLVVNRQSRRLWNFWWKSLVNCCCLPPLEESNS